MDFNDYDSFKLETPPQMNKPEKVECRLCECCKKEFNVDNMTTGYIPSGKYIKEIHYCSGCN